jgi:hypothetical protein
MRDAGSIQFDARPPVGEPMDMSVWSDVTVSAADGGVRIVALDFAETKFPASSARLVDEAAATIAAHDVIVGADADVSKTGATSDRAGPVAVTDRSSATASKPSTASASDALHGECDKVLAFAIALSPPPLAAIEIEPESDSTTASSVAVLDTAPPSASSDRAVDVDSSLS